MATTLTASDPKRNDISNIVDIVTATCPPGSEQDYLWFIGKAGGLISQGCLQAVFQIILKMDIATNFPVQVAFISLCKNNLHSCHIVGALHQALQTALGGESRSWAIGAVLAASAHGGVGAADGFATNVYTDCKSKLETIATTSSGDNLEEFAKRSTPIFATLKAVMEVPLSPTLSAQMAGELASSVIPFCWTKLMRTPSVFELGANEYLSVMGSQFIQSVPVGSTSQMNACFQMYLLLTQVAGLCSCTLPQDAIASLQALNALFDPSWNLRPSLLNILTSNVASPASQARPSWVLKSVLPSAIHSLQRVVATNPQDDFTVSSISRASIAVVQSLLSALQIATDDELAVTDYSGAPKPGVSQKQAKAKLRSRNRFAAISEEAASTGGVQTYGPKIPYELLAEPEVALHIVSQCLGFRTDKALRRISQSVPTMITRWWNSVSHEASLAEKFVTSLPQYVLQPIIANLEMVRSGDPATLPGGQLYSYSCERAVSGRKLASELVDHSTISTHGLLSVMWRFAVGHRPGGNVDVVAVVTSSAHLTQSIRMILDSTRATPTNEAVLRIAGCAKEHSLESRAALKFVVEGLSRSGQQVGDATGSNGGEQGVIRATHKDMDAPVSRTNSNGADDHGPPGTLFG